MTITTEVYFVNQVFVVIYVNDYPVLGFLHPVGVDCVNIPPKCYKHNRFPSGAETAMRINIKNNKSMLKVGSC